MVKNLKRRLRLFIFNHLSNNKPGNSRNIFIKLTVFYAAMPQMTCHHMRQSAVSAGRSDSRKPLGKRGNQSEYASTVVCVCAALRGIRSCSGRMTKNLF